MNIPYAMKKCSKCGEWLVASKANFYKNKNCKYGLDSKCKSCISNYGRKRRDENIKINEKLEEKRQKKILEIKEKRSDDYKPITREQRLEFSKKHKEINDKNRKARKKFYRNYFGYKYQEKYRKSPKGQVAYLNAANRRRAKKQAQGSGITTEQWTEMMQYFDWKCAYSGETLNKKIRSVDHIIPLDKGGANEIWNLVPMHKFYNSSKQAKDMLEWYKQQDFFSEERLIKIREWQEYAYNKYYIKEGLYDRERL